MLCGLGWARGGAAWGKKNAWALQGCVRNTVPVGHSIVRLEGCLEVHELPHRSGKVYEGAVSIGKGTWECTGSTAYYQGRCTERFGKVYAGIQEELHGLGRLHGDSFLPVPFPFLSLSNS